VLVGVGILPEITMKTFLAALFSLLLLVASVACRSRQTEEGTRMVEGDRSVTAIPQFEDLPVPPGFRTDARKANERFVAEAGSFRLGRQVYVGPMGQRETVSYLEERVPHHGWILTERKDQEEVVFLRFTKSDSVANYQIRSLGFGEARIELEVTTRRSSSN